jgi:hypothetical protein
MLLPTLSETRLSCCDLSRMQLRFGCSKTATDEVSHQIYRIGDRVHVSWMNNGNRVLTAGVLNMDHAKLATSVAQNYEVLAQAWAPGSPGRGDYTRMSLPINNSTFVPGLPDIRRIDFPELRIAELQAKVMGQSILVVLERQENGLVTLEQVEFKEVRLSDETVEQIREWRLDFSMEQVLPSV